MAKALVDAFDEFRGRGGAASAHGDQAGGVPLGKIRGFHQIPGHGGDAHEIGDVLSLDEFEGALRAPLVHHDQARPGSKAGEHHRDAASHMEEWHRQDEAGRRGIRPGLRGEA